MMKLWGRRFFIVIPVIGLIVALSGGAAHAQWPFSSSSGGTSAGKQYKRVALVIGNSNYRHLSRLSNPVRDSRALARVLRRAGVHVMERHNLKRSTFLDVLEEFREQAASAREAIIFYGGHGMGLKGRDILAPIDMSYDCARGRYRRAIGLEKLREAISHVPKQVVILDACRNHSSYQGP